MGQEKIEWASSMLSTRRIRSVVFSVFKKSHGLRHYRGISLIRKCPPPQETPGALGIAPQ
jgi:hypothetical protein